MAEDAWDAVARAVAKARAIVDAWPDLPDAERAEGLRYVLRLVRSGIAVCVEHADPDAPSFVRMIAPDMKWGLDMPDCAYLYATVRAGRSYRIHGRRGSAHHLDVQVNAGHFADGEIGAWRTIASAHAEELSLGPDGELDVVLSEQRSPGGGDWLPLAADAEFVLVRQYFADWDEEQPAELRIERIDAPGDAPNLAPADLDVRLARLVQWIEQAGGLWDRMARGFLGLAPNSVIVHDPGASAEHVGLRDQTYALGNYRCAHGEAVVVELAPPRCHHLSASLANRFFESHDFAGRQGSLNGHQARRDDDGRLRLVIAHQDPGVPNWLDAAGRREGLLALRFLRAEGGAPQPDFRVVPLETLRGALPADTPIVSPDERAAQLARRAAAVDRRQRGY